MDVRRFQKRVVIVGAQGTGKSTLLDHLIQDLDLPVIREVSRTVASILGIPHDGLIAHQQRVDWQRGILWWQIALEESYGSFISDRSLIDHWAYSIYWLSEDKDFIDAFREIVAKQAKKYTHIIYLPPTLPFQENGFRSTDLSYVTKVDELIKGLLSAWFGSDPRKVKIIKEISLEVRVKESLAFITSPFFE